jgi:hypothetical protein
MNSEHLAASSSFQKGQLFAHASDVFSSDASVSNSKSYLVWPKIACFFDLKPLAKFYDE